MAEQKTVIEIPMEVRQSEALRRQQSKIKIIHEANDFTQRVSLIGLTHATNSKTPKSRRIVWIFWLVFGLGLAIYQIQDRIIYYSSYPYNTEFQIRTAIKEMRLPQVTICKEDWISKSKADEFGINEIFHRQWKILEDMLSQGEYFNESEYTEQSKPLRVQLHNSTKDWGTVSKNISHEWKDLVTYISWNGDGNRSIMEDLATDLGHCFTVGSDAKPLIAKEPGIRAGLEIYLNARQSDSAFVSSSDHEIFTGFRLLIHDPYELPRMLEAGFVISPGTITQVALSFENVTQLGPPYSDCETDPSYRVVNCLANWEVEFFLNKCNCKPFYYIDSEDDDLVEKPVCSFVEHEECLKEFQSSRKTSDDYQCNCSQQCHGRIYDYSISQSKISKKLLRFIETVHRSRKQNGSSTAENSTEQDDLTIIFIYFPNFMFKEVSSEASYSFLALLCDVGGALSLLLGATLLTVYEVAEFLALVAKDFLCTRIRD